MTLWIPGAVQASLAQASFGKLAIDLYTVATQTNKHDKSARPQSDNCDTQLFDMHIATPVRLVVGIVVAASVSYCSWTAGHKKSVIPFTGTIRNHRVSRESPAYITSAEAVSKLFI